jgi:hypothetical protein
MLFGMLGPFARQRGDGGGAAAQGPASVIFPAEFVLVAANPCPCGRLGERGAA